MKLHRLHAANFASIGDVDIEFGPGLNVLYGPNDLGKSTLVAAIRLALLLPHTSTHSEQYVGWNKAHDPRVELTFETEAQRMWRVKKVFGRSGSSLLEESKNGKDFDELERGRKVDEIVIEPSSATINSRIVQASRNILFGTIMNAAIARMTTWITIPASGSLSFGARTPKKNTLAAAIRIKGVAERMHLKTSARELLIVVTVQSYSRTDPLRGALSEPAQSCLSESSEVPLWRNPQATNPVRMIR